MNVLVVHGSFGKPFENWFPWMEGELCSRRIVCNIPTFPTPEHQQYSDWEELMNYYVKKGMVNEETVIVGHSCGAVFTTKYVIEHKLPVKGIMLFSGYNNFISGNEMMDQLNSSFYMNDEELADLELYAPKRFAFYGDDDPNIPQSVLHDFAEKIHAIEQPVHGAGHFNASAGYTKCEIALDTLIREFVL